MRRRFFSAYTLLNLVLAVSLLLAASATALLILFLTVWTGITFGRSAAMTRSRGNDTIDAFAVADNRNRNSNRNANSQN
jgi:hypothetical protein